MKMEVEEGKGGSTKVPLLVEKVFLQAIEYTSLERNDVEQLAEN